MIAVTIGQMIIQQTRSTGRRDEEEAVGHLLRGLAGDVVRRRQRHWLRSTFGATLRYQPSLIATSHSPPGKFGIVVGITSLYFSRSSWDT